MPRRIYFLLFTTLIVATISPSRGAQPGRGIASPGASPDQGSTPGQVRVNAEDGLRYVWIPAGSFLMGCSPGDSGCYEVEKPAHQVRLSKGFWIGQTEVTVGAYKRFVAATQRQMPSLPYFVRDWANDNLPIVNVSWFNAQAYCNWAGGRLLSEAEWEYAARGGNSGARYGGIGEIAWYFDDSSNHPHEVAQKRPNKFGLFDMLGNVWEWVNDWYDPKYYQRTESRDPAGPERGELRVMRGGSWSDAARVVRVSDRGRALPGRWDYFNGIRCGM